MSCRSPVGNTPHKLLRLVSSYSPAWDTPRDTLVFRGVTLSSGAFLVRGKMSAAHRSVADPRWRGIRRIALRFSIIFQNVCTAPNKPTDSVEPSTTYTAYSARYFRVGRARKEVTNAHRTRYIFYTLWLLYHKFVNMTSVFSIFCYFCPRFF